MLRSNKEQLVSKLSDSVQKAAAVLFVDFTGLTVAEVEKFRRTVRAQKLGYRVVKNTLMLQALNQVGKKGADSYLQGTPTGVVLGYDDPVAAAKVAFDFSKECAHLKIKGGFLETSVLNAKQAEDLAKMPGRVELQRMILATALAPGRRIAGQALSAGRKIAGIIAKRVKDLEQ
jgi:large subunit ribosomal protein L10